MCRDQAEKADVTLVAKLTDGIEIRADITRIKQVILNLLTNAIKFSLTGGVVNIELLRMHDERLALVVRDGGIGIKSEDLGRIFEPFVQAEDGMARRFSGIGLGLSIARKIARLHGGDVTLESQFGVGTTARFELPRSRVTWPRKISQSGGGCCGLGRFTPSCIHGKDTPHRPIHRNHSRPSPGGISRRGFRSTPWHALPGDRQPHPCRST